MLSDRQLELLKAVIQEYISSAEPVGSNDLVNKYNLKFSAATVRNEMAKLIDHGLLEMVHTSSGRIPTPNAYRFFIQELMEEEEIPVLQEIAFKQKLWPRRFEFEKMLREAMISLSDITKELTIATTADGYLVHAGAVNVLDNKEFWDINVAKAALYLLDRYELLEQILSKAQYGEDVRYLLGAEIGNEHLQECGIVFTPYNAENKSGFICVLGPARMNYPKIIPSVRYAKNLIEELAGSW